MLIICIQNIGVDVSKMKISLSINFDVFRENVFKINISSFEQSNFFYAEFVLIFHLELFMEK